MSEYQNIKRRYLLAVFIIALLAASAYITLIGTLGEQEEHARIINLSGKQRMLSQRSALYLSQYLSLSTVQQQQKAKQTLQKTVEEMRNIHNGLTKGNSTIDASPLHNSRIEQLYFSAPTNLDKRVRHYLDAIDAILQQPQITITTKSAIYLSLIEQSAKLLPSLNQVVTEYEHSSNEHIQLLKDIETLILSITFLTLFLEVLFIFRPLEKNIQQSHNKLRHALERAQSSEKVKAQFISNISHELRTPMNGIIGTIELLNNSSLQGRQKKLVEVLSESSTKLMKLLNNIMSHTNYQANSIQVTPVACHLHIPIEQAMQYVESEAQEKRLKLHYAGPSSPLPQFMVDSYLLEELLEHLLDNAVKYTADHGEINVRLTAQAAAKQEDCQIEISVTDNGIGIEKSKLEEVFQGFTQVDESTIRSYEGAGLGLSIAQNIANAMGGSIHVESTLGEGSTFTVELTLQTADPDNNTPALTTATAS